MPRTARKKSVCGIYHIVLRGVNRQTVFYDDEDREVFLSRLKITKEKIDYDLYAFCFMGNHIHLIIKEKAQEIGKIMQNLLSSYIFWYNSKYERVGNLFQDRYKSEPIDTDNYLLCAVRYVHQNPVKARIVNNPKYYKWSSYNAYLNDRNNLVDTEVILSILKGQEGYKQFMAEEEKNLFLEPSDKIHITDDKLAKEIKIELGIKEINELLTLSREDLYKALAIIMEIKGANHYQVSRVTGVPMGIIRNV